MVRDREARDEGVNRRFRGRNTPARNQGWTMDKITAPHGEKMIQIKVRILH